MSTTIGPIDGNKDIFQKSAQKLFAIAIGGDRRCPDFCQIGTKRLDFIFFFCTEGARAL